MELELYEQPIEELNLKKEIIKKLKDVFIYTIGDLQGKTFETLQQIPGFDLYVVGIIQGALVKKTKNSLSEDIQEEDKIENLGLNLPLIRKLKTFGIWKISDLMKLSGLELGTIGITDKAFKLIEEALIQKYGEKYEEGKSFIMDGNSDAISLGHLEITKGQFISFRKNGIYTIGDFQRKTDRELKDLPGIGKGLIEIVKKELERHEKGRYKEGEDRIGVLPFSKSDPYDGLSEINVTTLEKLGNMTFSELEATMRRRVSIENIIQEYLKYTLLNCGKSDGKEVSELQVLTRISKVLLEIRSNQQLRIKKLKTIAEEIAIECIGNEEM